MNDYSRELGVDFGNLMDDMDGVTYPITNTDLLERYGSSQLELSDGVVTLEEVLGPLEEVLGPLEEEAYANEGDVQQAVFNLIGERAIGRKHYSDRDPPTLGEDHLNDTVSL